MRDVKVDGCRAAPCRQPVHERQANHTIDASFLARSYAITVAVPAGGGSVSGHVGGVWGGCSVHDPRESCYTLADVKAEWVP
jgi:hypothetical protein